MTFPAILYVLFALLSAGGMFLVVDHFRGRGLAMAYALAVLILFAALGVALALLVQTSGL